MRLTEEPLLSRDFCYLASLSIDIYGSGCILAERDSRRNGEIYW